MRQGKVEPVRRASADGIWGRAAIVALPLAFVATVLTLVPGLVSG